MNDKNLLNAIGEFDDRHIRAEEFNSLFKKRKPIKTRFKIIAVCAAAAVALSLIVGARDDIKIEPFIYEYYAEGADPVRVEARLTAKNFPVPEEFIPLFEDDSYAGKVKTLDEYNDIFGIEPLITGNENFTIREDYLHYQIFDTGILVGYYDLMYHYYMHDKNIGEHRIDVQEEHFTDPAQFGYGGTKRIDEDENVEFLILNDGSPCVIEFNPASEYTNYSLGHSYAHFAYNGSYYCLHISETDDEPGTIEHVKTVLSDLGVL